MVECTNDGSETPREQVKTLEQVNLSQMVHIKAFQDGYLFYDRKYKRVPGYIWGEWQRTHGFDQTSSFLPFQTKENAYIETE